MSVSELHDSLGSQCVSATSQEPSSQLHSQSSVEACSDLAKIAAAWPTLSKELRDAILAILKSNEVAIRE
jgi:hypothetical protein